MLFELGGVTILLASNDACVVQLWRDVAEPFVVSAENNACDVHITLNIVDQLPRLPVSPPIYCDYKATAGRSNILDAYQLDNGNMALHFHDGAYVLLPAFATDQSTPPHIVGSLTHAILSNGRFEDVVMVSLAPLLRRRGVFFVHAAGVTRNEKALLLVGPSGSGKTTTLLALVLDGWQMLANDVVIVMRREGVAYAAPTPDSLTLRPNTRRLLPFLNHLPIEFADNDGVTTIPARVATADRWGEAASVAALCFPQIADSQTSSLEPTMHAIALAQLMEQSLDSWDEATLSDHAAILAELTQQAACYRVHLGRDVATLPLLLQTLVDG